MYIQKNHLIGLLTYNNDELFKKAPKLFTLLIIKWMIYNRIKKIFVNI